MIPRLPNSVRQLNVTLMQKHKVTLKALQGALKIYKNPPPITEE